MSNIVEMKNFGRCTDMLSASKNLIPNQMVRKNSFGLVSQDISIELDLTHCVSIGSWSVIDSELIAYKENLKRVKFSIEPQS